MPTLSKVGKALQIGLIALALSLSAAWGETVCAVHDGDTLTTCSGKKVRIEGIDAPELRQPFGPQARLYLEKLTDGKAIALRCTGKSYNRQVCQVTVLIPVDPTRKRRLDVGREMVGRGLAWDYAHYSRGKYLNAQRFAEKEGRGIWSQNDGGETPWCFRHPGKGDCQ